MIHIFVGLFANATSGKFVASLMGVKNKSSAVAAKHRLNHHVKLFEDIERKSYTVRNDMTNERQTKLFKKMREKLWRKAKTLGHDSRGRRLKISEFPELSRVLEQIFQVSYCYGLC